MKWFARQKETELEQALREDRPQPSADFVRSLSEDVRAARRVRWHAPRLRLAGAVGITTLMLAGAGVFGGVVYATGGGPFGGPSHHPKPHPKPGDHQYKEKVLICHKAGHWFRITLFVPRAAVPAHLAHGDRLGACPRPIWWWWGHH